MTRARKLQSMSSVNEFEGQRTRLRAVEPEDWEVFHAMDLDTELSRLDWDTHFPSSKAGHREWAERESSRPTDDRTRFAIETLDGTVVGTINVAFANRRHGVFSYGLGLAREHRRKGYGREAVLMVLRFFFRELGYHKVEVGVYGFNEGSLLFHDALGMQREGCKRSCHFTQGRYHDEILFGMLSEEFDARYGEPTQ